MTLSAAMFSNLPSTKSKDICFASCKEMSLLQIWYLLSMSGEGMKRLHVGALAVLAEPSLGFIIAQALAM